MITSTVVDILSLASPLAWKESRRADLCKISIGGVSRTNERSERGTSMSEPAPPAHMWNQGRPRSRKSNYTGKLELSSDT